MAYTRINWQDGPSGGTPLSAANLNHMDQGIADAHADLDAATASPTANELIRRDASGRASVADPTSASHIATKGYVDQNFVPRKPIILQATFTAPFTIPVGEYISAFVDITSVLSSDDYGVIPAIVHDTTPIPSRRLEVTICERVRGPLPSVSREIQVNLWNRHTSDYTSENDVTVKLMIIPFP